MKCKLSVGEKLPVGIRRVARKQMDRVAGLADAEAVVARAGAVGASSAAMAEKNTGDAAVGPARNGGQGLAPRGSETARGGARAGTASGRRSAGVDAGNVAQRTPGRNGGPGLGEIAASFLETTRPGFRKGAKEKTQGSDGVAGGAAEGRGLAAEKSLRWPELCRGAGEVYREGREVVAQAGRTRSTEDLHEWRKRVKDLWYGLRVLEAWQPDGLAGVALEMKELSKLLGDDHDLAMLEAASKRAI